MGCTFLLEIDQQSKLRLLGEEYAHVLKEKKTAYVNQFPPLTWSFKRSLEIPLRGDFFCRNSIGLIVEVCDLSSVGQNQTGRENPPIDVNGKQENPFER